MRIKKNPSLQDKSAAQKHEHVRTNALTEVLQIGGQVSDRLEVIGEYLLVSFLVNDVGYTSNLTV